MNFTYWVTEDCNLKCKYCYVSKVPKMMSRETAAKAIDFTQKSLLQILPVIKIKYA